MDILGSLNGKDKTLVTKDYSVFKHLKGNRDISEPHVLDVIEKIKQAGGQMMPVIVNELMEIIDGQHRVIALQRLKMPVYYVIRHGWGLEEAQILNSTSKQWNDPAYLKSYVQLESPEYLKYYEFKKKFGFGHSVNLALLSGHYTTEGGTKHNKEFREGKFTVKKWNEAVEIAERVTSLKGFYVGYKRRPFINAMAMLSRTRGYNHDHMLQKMKFRHKLLVHCVSVDQYLDILVMEIYNYKSSAEDRLELVRGKNNKYKIVSAALV